MTTRAPKTGTPRTSVMSVRMPPELRQQVEQAAIAAGMSLSAYIADTLAKASLPRQAVPAAAPVGVQAASVACLPTFTQGAAFPRFPTPAANITPPSIPATVRAAHAQHTPQVQPVPAIPLPPTRPAPTSEQQIHRERGHAPTTSARVNMPVNTAVNGQMAQPPSQVDRRHGFAR